MYSNVILTAFIVMFYLRADNVKSTNFDDVPVSLKMKICRYFENDDLFNLAHTCKESHHIVKEIVRNKKFSLDYLLISPENIRAGISHTSLFTQIVIRGYTLNSKEIKTLTRNPNLSTINLNCSFMASRKFKTFAKEIQSNDQIKVLSLKNIGIEAKKTKVLYNCLKKNQSLSVLNLGYNSLGNKGCKIISGLLGCGSITELKLNHNVIEDDRIKVLCQNLINRPILGILKLDFNKFGIDGVKYLAETLPLSHKLMHLSIAYNNIDNIGIGYLSNALNNKTTYLKSLNILGNIISDLGMKYLCQSLKINKNFQLLNLRFNEIGDKSVEGIIGVINENDTLQSLNLSYNKFSNINTDYILNSIQKNKTLTELNLL